MTPAPTITILLVFCTLTGPVIASIERLLFTGRAMNKLQSNHEIGPLRIPCGYPRLRRSFTALTANWLATNSVGFIDTHEAHKEKCVLRQAASIFLPPTRLFKVRLRYSGPYN